ncbi:hypothetical protein MOQ_005960 [Trypanosoma cruzi marinkellei]|uniref:Uncharacterized protein n=1 Tax=Trypanosoma cruzi marinkellei TaxID=85056 RepID=K2MT46_TRYCR|nr:hypothetical protein MOQ_005960 [Trypanosoma cruzi marinkellei]
MTTGDVFTANPPFVLVDQFCEGRPYDTMSFPDAFEITPNSWQYRPAAADVPGARMSPLPIAAHCTHKKIKHYLLPLTDASHLTVRSGMHEEQRMQLQRRAQERRELQMISGQATHDACFYRPCARNVVAKEQTAENRRRSEVRDAVHTAWLERNSEFVAFCATQRRLCLLSLETRRQKRMELEHRAGSSLEKLQCLREGLFLTHSEGHRELRLSPVAADES